MLSFMSSPALTSAARVKRYCSSRLVLAMVINNSGNEQCRARSQISLLAPFPFSGGFSPSSHSANVNRIEHDRGFERRSSSTRLSQKKPRNYLDPQNNLKRGAML